MTARELPYTFEGKLLYTIVSAMQDKDTDNFAHLLPPSWKTAVTAWLQEDIPSFDYGGFVVGEKPETATLWCKSPGVLAGVPFVDEIFKQVECNIEWHVAEGTWVDASDASRVAVASVTGAARNLLLGERTALNLLARCAGIATRARRLAQLKHERGFAGAIAGTRKTTPGFRLVEKHGMLVGGCDPHRMDLSAMIMLKDNHVWSAGSIPAAIAKARRAGGFALKIEVECRGIDEARVAAAAGADIVMLDNMGPAACSDAAGALKQQFPHLLIEVSGGITEETAANYFSPHVDVLSMGGLTQGVPFVDYSLKINHD